MEYVKVWIIGWLITLVLLSLTTIFSRKNLKPTTHTFLFGCIFAFFVWPICLIWFMFYCFIRPFVRIEP